MRHATINSLKFLGVVLLVSLLVSTFFGSSDDNLNDSNSVNSSSNSDGSTNMDEESASMQGELTTSDREDYAESEDSDQEMLQETVEEEIIVPTVELDVASNTEIIKDLLGKINYNEALQHYQKYFSKQDIITIQEELQNEGVNCGTVDGVIGQKTIAAIVHYQEFYGITLTGVLDENTSKKLGVTYSNLDAYRNIYGRTVVVTLVRSYLSYNNHVGNDWGTAAEANGYNLRSGKATVKLDNGEHLELMAAASEQDSVMDYGSATKRISYSELISGKTTNYELDVIVRENRGRYSGNTAQWVFIIEVKVL